jgi:polyisoprenoid-binding protein YceI
MPIKPGTYTLGPQNATLTVRTGRRGAIAKVGHDLRIEVTGWGATVEIAPDPTQSVLELDADSNSLQVREGTGGIQSLGDDDRAGINATIIKDVLKGTAIVFRSRSVEPEGEGRLSVEGDLELAGGINPVTFTLDLGDDGHVRATALLTQSAWGMKPYTAMFGALKVADNVEVSVDGTLSPAA